MRSLLLGLVLPLAAADLPKADSVAFDQYAAKIEASLAGRAKSEVFLWHAQEPATVEALRRGDLVVTAMTDPYPQNVGHSLLHDWAGAVFIPGAKIDAVLALLQDFNRHKKIYSAMVADSRPISQNGQEYRSYLRLRQKKVITILLDTEYATRYYRPSEKRAYSVVHATKISEVKNAGDSDEKALPPGTGYGFLWRLNSYWLLEQRDDGVLAEFRSVTLTRDIPAGLNWIVAPMVKNLPKETLEFTLEKTRETMLGDQRAGGSR